MKHRAVLSFAGLVIAAVVVVMGLSVLSRQAGSSQADKVGQPAVAQTTSAPAMIDDLRINRVVRHGSFTTLVLSMRNYCGKLLEPNPDPQKKFVSVELVIGNQSGQVLPLALQDSELITENDTAYPLMQDGCPPAFSATAIPSNGLARGQLVFVIPAGETPKMLRYLLADTLMTVSLRY